MLLAFVLIAPQEAEASHIAGADISYQCLDDGRYVITINLYRDCNGISMPTTLPLQISSDSCGVASVPGFSLPQDTFYEVSQLCPSVISQSTCNGGTLPGYEVYVYSDTISFPQTCEDWVVGWGTCCRNGSITTGGANASNFIAAMINNNFCNDSPIFNSLPVPYFCAGQQYDYNHGANDPEGDTLYYALTCPNTNGLNQCPPYLPGLSPTQPIYTSPANTFGFNQNTGQMTFTPQNNTAQIGIAGVTVYNVLNGDTIGFVQRDIQMVILNSINCTSPVSSNNPAVIAGGSFDTTANSFVVCAGQSLQFSIKLTDPDGDTITIDQANTNINQVFGAGNVTIFQQTFRPDSIELFININAVPSSIGVNQFTIGITDNACPIPGNQILSYNLIIPGVEVTARDTVICPGIAQQVQMTANSFSSIGGNFPGSYQWTQLSGIPITFSDDTILNPLVNTPAGSVDGDSIVLELSFTTIPDPSTGTQCVTTDSVKIFFRALPLTVIALTSDTSLCPNFSQDTISTATGVFGPGVDLVNGVYNWTSVPANYVDSLSNTNTNNPNIVSSGGPGDTTVYTVTYTYGDCIGSDDVLIYWRDGIPDVTASADTVCPGDTIQLNAVLTDTITRLNPAACSTYSVAPIAYAPIAGTGTQVSSFTFSSDDGISAALPIGFSFNFFCNNYTQFVMSTNGFISFDLNSPNGCCSGQAVGNPFGPNDYIALAWEDLNVTGDALEYFTVGTAPNRILVVNYTTVSHHPAPNNQPVTVQALLYETTNVIEIHTTTQPDPSGNHTQGIENVDGTLGYAVPGRDGQPWTATNDAYRFTPQAPLVFTPITYNWIPGFAVSDATIHNPTSVIQGTTTYIAQITQGDCVLEDSVEVAVRSTIPAPTVTCGTPANQATSVLFEWGMSPGAAGWEYSLDSGLTWIPRPLADSSLLIGGLTNGDCANVLVRATGGTGVCPTNSATYLECCTTPCPPPNTTLTTNLNCNSSNDGTINIGITGGVLGNHPNFDVTLFDTSGAVIGNRSTADTARFTGLSADVYYAYIIDTLGCFTYSDTVVLTQPDTMILNLDSTTLTTCFADTDGTAAVFGTGGTLGYSFQWPASAANQTGMMATGLGRGIYDVVLTDANGCMDTLAVRVNSPFPALPSATVNTTNSTSCAGNGTASIFATLNLVGNATAYTYQWSAGTQSANGFDVTDLPSGPHSVTVTDINGCQAIENFTIAGSPALTITNFTTINPGCNLSDGQATVVATGDSAGYNYQWDANAANQTTGLATGLGVGTYVVTVTGSSNGCTAIDSVVLVNNGGVDIVGFNIVDPSCGGNDGTATVQYTGATGAVTYNWSNAGTTQTITGLAVGTYTVTVTDAANCSDIADTVLVQETITASITDINDPNCNLTNGNLTVGVTGATGPFTYLWSNGVTDAVAQGLGAGTYTVTATYQGCTATTSGVLTAQSLQIAITDKDDITCNNDGDAYAYVVASNNSSPVTYQWTGPNGFTSANDSIMNLAAGSYTVVASLGTGCSVSQSINVVDVTLTANAWIVTPGQDRATIQINDQVDLNAGVVTNHFNPTFAWTEQNPGVVTIDDMADTATFVTGQPSTGSTDTWLYFTATAGPCTVMDSVWVEVQSYLGMPTAFTPNGDGINDLFRPAGLQNYTKVFKFEIYNRFGQLVYNDAANPQWDGTFNGVAQPRDVYIYVFEYVTDTGEVILVRGEFTLLR